MRITVTVNGAAFGNEKRVAAFKRAQNCAQGRFPAPIFRIDKRQLAEFDVTGCGAIPKFADVFNGYKLF
jgi:hypothetical protein